MPIEIDTVIASDRWNANALQTDIEAAIAAAARSENMTAGEVSLLLADDARLAELNAAWRGKTGPTNVLSFPAPVQTPGFLGDIALAFETLEREALSQNKTLRAHAMHLAVHGFLHLLGYDHVEPSDAEAMEARERAILAELGLPDPYA